MIMKPSFEADMFCHPEIILLNAKQLVYLKVSAGFRLALPSLLPFLAHQHKIFGGTCKH